MININISTIEFISGGRHTFIITTYNLSFSGAADIHSLTEYINIINIINRNSSSR